MRDGARVFIVGGGSFTFTLLKDDGTPIEGTRCYAYNESGGCTGLYGATDDYVVTRAFAEGSTRAQREDLLRTAFAVGAADDTITAAESAELNQIGKELGFRSDEIDAIRDEFRDQLAAIQAMRRARGRWELILEQLDAGEVSCSQPRSRSSTSSTRSAG